jgi:ribosome modulation factor
MALETAEEEVSSAATLKAAMTDDDTALRGWERARCRRGRLTAALKPGRPPAFATKGNPPITAAVRRQVWLGGWRRGRTGATRGLHGPQVEASPRNQRVRLTPAWHAHAPGDRRPSRRVYMADMARRARRALERGTTHSSAARFNRLEHSFSQNFAT